VKYIEDFQEDENIVGHYLCKKRESLKSRSGKTYLSLKLQDKTGKIDAKVWELNNNIQSFEENDFIKIDAVVLTYQNSLQLKVSKIRKSQPGEYNEADFIPSTNKNVDVLYEEILTIIKSINNVYIKKLLENIFIDNSDITSNIKTHSAAKLMHHSYMGGLIEHLVSVAQICDFMSTRYKFVNRDILVAGALLHDLGKIYELSAFPDNNYTDDGELLGHIVIGTELLTSEASKIEGFPKQLLSLMKHCIISHHGELEYGSPQLPKTIEAFILHSADDVDAKVKMYEEMMEKDNGKNNWVGYHHMLKRNIRKSEFDEK